MEKIVKHGNELPREVTIPGGIQQMTGCGTWYYGLIDKVVISPRLDPVIPFSYLNDFVIL